MVATRRTNPAHKRTATAAKSSNATGGATNAAPSNTRTRRAKGPLVPDIQVPRTPTPDPIFDDSETERLLEAKLKRVERQNRVAILQEKIALARKGNKEASSGASSQTLLRDPVVDAPGVEAPRVEKASEVEILKQRPGLFPTGMKHDFLPLSTKFPTISMKHLKNIAENKFLPENICRLHNDYTQVKPEKKFFRMGDIDLQTREDDAAQHETKGIVQLTTCFLNYMQILAHLTNSAVQSPLFAAMTSYFSRIMGHYTVRTWESVRAILPSTKAAS